MTTDDKIRDVKLQYDINREAVNISVFYHLKKIFKKYHLKKLINMNILQVKKYHLLIKEE